MKRCITYFIPVFIVLISLLPISQENTAFAQNIYKDGEYTIPFTVLKADGSGASETNTYIEQSAKLIVKDGKTIVQMTLKNASWWQNFTVGGQGVTTVSEGNDSRVVQVSIANIDQLVSGNISVKVPDVYEGNHDVKLKFNAANVPTASGTAAAADNGNAAGNGEAGDKEANPQTGDNAPIVLFSVALLASGLFLGRKFIFAK